MLKKEIQITKGKFKKGETLLPKPCPFGGGVLMIALWGGVKERV
jgi:hypothetical protein